MKMATFVQRKGGQKRKIPSNVWGYFRNVIIHSSFLS